MTFLKLDGLSKTYGDYVAVKGLSLDINRGEFISLLGPSGCGKTTTLQMVAGFVEPTHGRIVVDGQDVTKLRPEKRGMGVVFQSYALFPHMTVADNVSFGLEMRGMARPERQKRIAETLELVHLNGLDKRYPRELSGGQRQRRHGETPRGADEGVCVHDNRREPSWCGRSRRDGRAEEQRGGRVGHGPDACRSGRSLPARLQVAQLQSAAGLRPGYDHLHHVHADRDWPAGPQHGEDTC